VLYNRASADAQGRPWDPERTGIAWNGQRWVGDTPDYTVDSAPDAGLGAFIMLPEGVARFFVPGQFVEGPWSEHYEPMESPIDNPLHPAQSSNPAVRQFMTDYDVLGTADEFPIVCTTYRLTEHFHYWTKHVQPNAVMQPEFFIEMSEQLAEEKKIRIGSWVKVTSNRGFVKAKAVVTKRLQPMQIDGKTVHVIGIPIHWGFTGVAKKGYGVNVLGPVVGDANIETPEFKAYQVDVEPTTPPTEPAVASLAADKRQS
jgi:formate dehydrogenase major subunit